MSEPTFNVISCDGGGVRGIYSARLLHRLRKRVPHLLSRTTLYAGTSTGGIIALGLAAGMAPSDLVDLYREHSKSIFKKRWFGGLWGAKYSAAPLRKILTDIHQDRTLGELPRFVVIPSYALDSPATLRRPRMGKPKFFESVGDAQERVVDVAMATSAAPTYFPASQGHIDGGCVANNPAACAAAQALLWGASREHLRVLSIGTGTSPSYITGHPNDWGLVQWGPKVPGLLIAGPAGVMHTLCDQLLDSQYHRLDGTLPRDIALDDVNAVSELIELADAVDLEPTVRWLEGGW